MTGTVARNMAIDQLRRKSRRPRHEPLGEVPAADVAPGNFDPYLFSNFHRECVLIHPGDTSVDSAAGNYPVTFSEIGQHLAMIFVLLLLRPNQQKVENGEHRSH